MEEIKQEELGENEQNTGTVLTQSVETTDNTVSKSVKKMETVQISDFKRIYRRGLIHGFVIMSAIAICITVLVVGIKFVKSIQDGSFFAWRMSSGSGSLLDSKTVEKLDKIYGIIDEDFIEETDKEKLREGLYRGLMDSLDDVYSTYYNEEEFAEMMESSEGAFEGIGAYLTQDEETMAVKVVRPIKDSPAEKAGILAGDIFVSVDGEDVSGQDLNLVVSKVRGESGSVVRIGVVREGEDDVIYFDITRAKVNSISCDYEMLDNNIGYIAISEFADKTDEQFVDCYNSLVTEGMTSLIIDLRSNGGGYVDTSVEIADMLVKEGTIVSLKDRNGKGPEYRDRGDNNYTEIPCVLLVDGNTASASEILTGALKDYGIATVIGTQTFGKGIVQDIIPLGDGSGMKITSSKYYTPNGYNIHGVGITPDIVVEFDGDRYVNEHIDNQLEAAKNYLLNGSVEE